MATFAHPSSASKACAFSLLEKLVDVSGPATASLTGSGDYASMLATLKR
jgi:hypothetical protein